MYASSSIRRAAFDRLAELATRCPKPDGVKDPDIDRLVKACHRPKTQQQQQQQPNGLLDDVLGSRPTSSSSPEPQITLRELDVLLALCKTAPSVTRKDHASRLASQFNDCLASANTLLPPSTPFLSTLTPSPWEELTRSLTTAVFSLALRHDFLQESVLRSTSTYINNCLQASKDLLSVVQDGEEDAGEHAYYRQVAQLQTLTVSLVGFLEGASTYAHFWEPEERLQVISQIRSILSEPFLVAVETASSTVRNSESSSSSADNSLRDWRRYAKRYAASGRPLGSMLLQQAFMSFVTSCTSLTDDVGRTLPNETVLDRYINGTNLERQDDDSELPIVQDAVGIATEMIQLIEDGSDYLQLGSNWQQRLAFSVKASALLCFLNCAIIDQDAVDMEAFYSWLDDTLSDSDQMASEELAAVTLKAMAVVARLSPHASSLSRALLRFIVHSDQSRPTVGFATRSLAQILHFLSQDAVIGTLYSLGNLLSANPATEKNRPGTATTGNGSLYKSMEDTRAPTNENLVLLTTDGDEDTAVPYRNVIRAITIIATSSNDSKIVALVQSMLLQKVTKINVVADSCIIEEATALALKSAQPEFELLLKYYTRLHRKALEQDNSAILDAVQKARNQLAKTLDKDSPLYRPYLVYLLENIVNKGAAADRHKSDSHEAAALAAEDITPFLKPLAILMAKIPPLLELHDEKNEYEDVFRLIRDAWFNIAAHDISLISGVGKRNRDDLRIIAEHSPPLVAENKFDPLESDIELNTILRRGANTPYAQDKKSTLLLELPVPESDVKKLSYPKSVFLNAALLVESLRSSGGDCTKAFTYFLDPALNSFDMVNCMRAIVEKVIEIYLEKALSGNFTKFSAPYISEQLAETFMASCHRIEKVQQVASAAATRIIKQCPSSLCEKRSLFTLLDLLTLLWSSCQDEELDEFEWRSLFTAADGTVKVELPDNYDFRQRTLNNLHSLARSCVSAVMNIASLDIKGLLQTYLSEHEDDGAYGHISMGRSFALEMGSTIPSGDQRLGSIDNHGNNLVNVASDFIAQYTTRQEYRHSEKPTITDREEWPLTTGQALYNNTTSSPGYADAVRDMESALAGLEVRISREKRIPMEIPRNILRRAAALLCSCSEEQPSIISHLVNIPFQMFTADSINMGISLWLGVIHERPRTEARMLVEVAQAWERTIQRKQGIFSPDFKWTDPFITKTESLPSDKNAMVKRQRKAQQIISPHLRVFQFLESHFNATRLRSINTQRIFQRLISATLVALLDTSGHPLAREIHFHIILFGLKVLRYSTRQSKMALWKLKDQILSAALSWFCHPPKWSFGGNRLQVKAEDKILHDIETMLRSTSLVGSSPPGARKSLESKQELLSILIESERSRLKVWLSPLDVEKRHYLSGSGSKPPSEATISSLLRLAWAENPNLAMQLTMRFPYAKLRNDVRWLLLNFPTKGLSEPDALEILLGSSLPQDVSFQLKYLLYWAPVNPIAAVTYFLPAYGNHPFILQYAMRSLESHGVDVSFFYIPQLVQALRYDTLGYVEQFLLEAAQQSPQFAHQVIWNMKANSYKDEDSQVPDPLKPEIDKFIDQVISSFSESDREFYEREFSFFNEVTGVSGKLRPYIKRTKPEKKEKIEEELRKIKVEVGVYLPSNPDGVVVGIDRKSGKPLQSHAKAPYMATFRIKKTKKIEDNGNGNGNGSGNAGGNALAVEPKHDRGQQGSQQTNHLSVQGNGDENENTYDVWQSAIFKVGDDCRQDVLALQMIAAFRSIFSSVGLDVFVYPYRVVATAPGCGVIDVLPNSISRDMLGREAVNGLYDYFVSRYGGEQSTRFQEARGNFVKSMAAYSVISYLLQFKDRHNGNIMIDEAGHIIHIDFGFCFDIAPGGVRFERAPFKLTTEMIAVMGGISPQHPHHQHQAASPSSAGGGGGGGGGSSSSTTMTGGYDPTNSQSYRWFESLVVKAFLASRPYTTKLTHIVTLMLDSGLPCFKPDTLKNFQDRFVLDKTEQEAAAYMRDLIKKSYASISTKGYDQFQLMTNNIPY